MPPKTKAPAKSLSELRSKMDKKYGDGRVSRRETVKPYEVTSTGSLELDLALRVGGWVEGRIHEVVGVEGVGKTTVCINSMANSQKKYAGGKGKDAKPLKACGYIDMEQTFDWEWAEKQGLDTSDERFVHVFPDNSEDVSDQIKEMIETGLFSMIVVDSIGGMESKQAFDKEAEEHVMGRNAQIITRMSKRLAVMARQYAVTILLVNQYRANLSNPQGGDQSAGPKAMKYATTTKLELRRTGETPLKYKFPDFVEPQVVAKHIRGRVTRNKVAAEGKFGEFWLVTQETPDFGPVGIDQAAEAWAIGRLAEVIRQDPGGYYWMPWTKAKEDRLRGEPVVKAYLRENREKALEVRDAAVAALAANVVPQKLVDFVAEFAEEGLTLDDKGELVEA